MLKSQFLIAFRNLVNRPMHSLIKISGLAVGVAGCLVIFLIVRYELSFDQFQADRDRIYRVYCQFSGLWQGTNRGVPMALPGKVRGDFSGLDAVTFFQTYSTKVIVTDSTGAKRKLDRQQSLVIADPDYFSVFNFYEWTAGSPQALEAPFGVVLTESKALSYFGSSQPENVIGKQVVYSDSLAVTVVGLVRNVREHTDFEFTDFISYSTIKNSWLKDSYNNEDDWGSVNSSSQCFIKLSKGTRLSNIEGQLPILVEAKEASNKSTDMKTAFLLQPLREMHFNSKLGIFDNGRSSASIQTLKTLGIIATLLLIVAAINFINLETAQAIKRAKEVGLRKVMGGTRAGLIRHFLTESFLITTTAVLLALPLSYLSFLAFSEFLPQGLELKMTDPFLWSLLVSTILLVSLFAGMYPAFVLSSYQPAVALKNMAVSGRHSHSAGLRRFLTVFQFSFSQVLIVGTLIVGMQISFMLDKDLGFATNAIVYVNIPWWEHSRKAETLLHELAKLPEIVSTSRNSRMPASSGLNTTTTKFNKGKEEILNSVHTKSGDTSYLSVFKLKLLAGRNVQPNDSIYEMLINETFCNKLGLELYDALGKVVNTNSKDYTIVGVLNDFHFQSLHHAIEPMYYRYHSGGNTIAIQLATVGTEIQRLDKTLEKINAAIHKIYPDEKLECQFFDKSIEGFYLTEKRIAKLTNTATGLAIFISCLGLFGLASFTAIQRTKEIGIRKVLGASVKGIVALLSREFLALVLVAYAIAVPLAWMAADKWLADFVYRITVSWWVFLIAGTLSIAIAFLTVGFQALKAALTDPVKSLRYE